MPATGVHRNPGRDGDCRAVCRAHGALLRGLRGVPCNRSPVTLGPGKEHHHKDPLHDDCLFQGL